MSWLATKARDARAAIAAEIAIFQRLNQGNEDVVGAILDFLEHQAQKRRWVAIALRIAMGALILALAYGLYLAVR